MRMFLAALVSFLLLISSVNVYADLMFGTDLKIRLDQKTMINESIALGYVSGVHDTVIDSRVCSPEQMTPQQAVEIVRKYLAERPEKLHEKASTLVIQALSTAFPCRK